MSEGWPSLQKPVAGGRWGKLDVEWALALQMLIRNRDVYLKTWKTNFLPPLLEPVLYLLSIGYGIGAFVDSVQGIPYPRFVAAGILGITMMQAAFFETTYNSFVRMWFQKTWDAVTATPLSLDDVLVGELAWAATKSAINATIMAFVIALFGLLPWLLLPLVPLLGFLVGLVFSGLGMMTSAKVKAIDGFSFAIYLFITPMMLFSGTFFPVSQLPTAAQNIAYALPLTHGVILARSIVEGALPPNWWASVLYLVAAALATCYLSIAWMRKRIVA